MVNSGFPFLLKSSFFNHNCLVHLGFQKFYINLSVFKFLGYNLWSWFLTYFYCVRHRVCCGYSLTRICVFIYFFTWIASFNSPMWSLGCRGNAKDDGKVSTLILTFLVSMVFIVLVAVCTLLLTLITVFKNSSFFKSCNNSGHVILCTVDLRHWFLGLISCYPPP